jgi:hypothetical protein
MRPRHCFVRQVVQAHCAGEPCDCWKAAHKLRQAQHVAASPAPPPNQQLPAQQRSHSKAVWASRVSGLRAIDSEASQLRAQAETAESSRERAAMTVWRPAPAPPLLGIQCHTVKELSDTLKPIPYNQRHPPAAARCCPARVRTRTRSRISSDGDSRFLSTRAAACKIKNNRTY